MNTLEQHFIDHFVNLTKIVKCVNSEELDPQLRRDVMIAQQNKLIVLGSIQEFVHLLQNKPWTCRDDLLKMTCLNMSYFYSLLGLCCITEWIMDKDKYLYLDSQSKDYIEQYRQDYNCSKTLTCFV